MNEQCNTIMTFATSHLNTKDTLAPGTVFIFASFLYATGAVFVSCIPSKKEAIAVTKEQEENIRIETDLEEPLLGGK